MKHGDTSLAALADLAIDAIRALVSDPTTPPSVRFRVAKFILESVEPEEKSEAPSRHTPAPAPKIGRNDYCPCGSGLKFKKCCLLKPAPEPVSAGPVFSTPRA